MRLLTAYVGDRPDDFAWTVPGELLYLAGVCDRDAEADRDHGCGCGRAFAGFTSRKATSTALVAEVDITRDQLVEMLRDRWGAAAEDVAGELVEIGESFPVGTLVERHLDRVEART